MKGRGREGRGKEEGMKVVGNGSRAHDLAGAVVITRLTSSVVQ